MNTYVANMLRMRENEKNLIFNHEELDGNISWIQFSLQLYSI